MVGIDGRLRERTPGEVQADGAELAPGGVEDAVSGLLDALHAVDADGWYPAIDVVRPWSEHNPRITGEFARPGALRRYLQRELTALLRAGARVTVRPARRALAFDDPDFFAALDEDRFGLRAKKLFLFGPERMALSLDRLSHLLRHARGGLRAPRAVHQLRDARRGVPGAVPGRGGPCARRRADAGLAPPHRCR
ncbi:MAG: hypothetical protein M3291_05985 [Actinomycetota bacterium]|nr:hypothetical protein [Actinomycetota bacterium]